MDNISSELVFFYTTSFMSLVLTAAIEHIFPRQLIKKPLNEYFQDIYCYILISTVIFFLDFVLLPYLKSSLGEKFLLIDFSTYHFAIQLLIFSLTVDFLYYISHRFLHYSKTLYQFHRWHHSSHFITASAGARQHVVDFFAGFIIYFPFVITTSFSKEVYYTYFAVYVFFSFLIHSNLNLNLGVLRFIFQTPNMHIWHHQKDVKRTVNFGFVLSVWDWIFQTSCDDKGIPDQFGFNGEEEYPESFLRRLLNKN